MSVSCDHIPKLDSNIVLGAINILFTYQSDVRRKFSHPQKLDANIHWPLTNELDCI